MNKFSYAMLIVVTTVAIIVVGCDTSTSDSSSQTEYLPVSPSTTTIESTTELSNNVIDKTTEKSPRDSQSISTLEVLHTNEVTPVNTSVSEQDIDKKINKIHHEVTLLDQQQLHRPSEVIINIFKPPVKITTELIESKVGSSNSELQMESEQSEILEAESQESSPAQEETWFDITPTTPEVTFSTKKIVFKSDSQPLTTQDFLENLAPLQENRTHMTTVVLDESVQQEEKQPHLSVPLLVPEVSFTVPTLNQIDKESRQWIKIPSPVISFKIFDPTTSYEREKYDRAVIPEFADVAQDISTNNEEVVTQIELTPPISLVVYSITRHVNNMPVVIKKTVYRSQDQIREVKYEFSQETPSFNRSSAKTVLKTQYSEDIAKFVIRSRSVSQ